jgi:hypothetical protein
LAQASHNSVVFSLSAPNATNHAASTDSFVVAALAKVTLVYPKPTFLSRTI